MTGLAGILAVARGATLTIVIVAVAVVVGGIFVWAAFIRRPARRHHHHHHRRHHRRDHRGSGPADAMDVSGRNWLGMRRRRKRRKERPSNPTLAETGGLPPKRGDRTESTGN